MRPALIAHADWSKHARKRWMATATLQPDGTYLAGAAQRVGALECFWTRLAGIARKGPVLVGFDFPIGVPRAYARCAGIEDFCSKLRQFDERFYTVAERPGQISVDQPFYPMPNRECDRQELLAGLGLIWSDLLRRCDRRSATRPEACALFWTLGGQQVGKAAITGWRDLLAPALRAGPDLALWPFQGSINDLLKQHRFVVAETYPAEFYRHLGLNLKGGKGEQVVRQANAPALFKWANSAAVNLGRELADQIQDGFGADARGDDRFDALVGLFGMLNVVLGYRQSGEPDDDDCVRRVEGWILGQQA